MAQGYIQLEGVNIYDTLGDTNQLSVIRGGSWLLKQAVEEVAGLFGLEAIASGASSGLYRLEADNLCRTLLDTKQADIQAWLQAHPEYRYLTFTLVGLLDTEIPTDGFQHLVHQLTAQQRFQQLQQLNFAPDYLDGADSNNPCALEGIKPASVAGEQSYVPNSLLDNDVNGTGLPPVSASVAARAKAGVLHRKAFLANSIQPLEKLAAPNHELTLTRTLEDIADCPAMGNLHNKLALVYMDGNAFGELKRNHVKTAGDHRQFDETLQGQRQTLLDLWCSHLVVRYQQASDCQKDQVRQQLVIDRAPVDEGIRVLETQLRFEALLWGGDELLFVVPAWQGFELLSLLYQTAQRWHYEGNPLTHAGGMVLCKATTPIFRVRDIARQLADRVKDAAPDNRSKNLYDYLVLESIDYPTEPVKRFRARCFGSLLLALNSGLPIPDAKQLTALSLALEATPRRQVYQLAEAVFQHYQAVPPSTESPLFSQPLARLQQMMGADSYQALAQALVAVFGNSTLDDGSCWVHLRELWDYIVPTSLAKEQPHV